MLYFNTRECIVARKGFEAALYRNTIDCIVIEAGHGLYCNTATVSCDTEQALGAGRWALGRALGAHAGHRGARGAQGAQQAGRARRAEHDRLGGLGTACVRWLGQVGALCT